MSGHPAADLAALDLLLWQRRIFTGDYQAGSTFAFLAARRAQPSNRAAYVAAVDVLDGSGGRSAVEAIVLGGRLPRSDASLDRAQNGLDALHTHFQREGLL